MDLGFVIPLAVFAGVALGIAAIYSLMVQEPRMVRERIERYEARSTEASRPKETATLLKDRRMSGLNWLDGLLRGTNFAEKMALDVARAGLPLRVGEYILVRWLSGGFLAFVVLATGRPWIIAFVAGAVGFYLPRFYLNHLRQKRVKKVTAQLIDAITLIANSLKSGYSFPQGMELVTREMPAPIAEEFQQMLAEMNLGGSAEEALLNLNKRVPSYDLELVTTALMIQRQVGGNLAEVLESIVHTIRERIRIMGEVKSRTAQVRMSGYVIGLMPLFMILAFSLINPTYMSGLFTTGLGILMLVAAFTMETLGFLVMKRLVAIEI